MVTYKELTDGVYRYAANEMLPKLDPIKQAAMATYLMLAARKLPEYIEHIAKKPAVEMLGVIENGRVDFETIANEFRERMPDRVPLKVPIINVIYYFTPDEIAKIEGYVAGNY